MDTKCLNALLPLCIVGCALCFILSSCGVDHSKPIVNTGVPFEELHVEIIVNITVTDNPVQVTLDREAVDRLVAGGVLTESMKVFLRKAVGVTTGVAGAGTTGAQVNRQTPDKPPPYEPGVP